MYAVFFSYIKHNTANLYFFSRLFTFTTKYIMYHMTKHHLLLFATPLEYRHGSLVLKHWAVMISISVIPSEISFQCVLVCVYLDTVSRKSNVYAWVCWTGRVSRYISSYTKPMLEKIHGSRWLTSLMWTSDV